MSTCKQDKAIKNFQQIWQLSKTNSNQQMQWLLRALLLIYRQPSLSMSGFVLPTVAMVSLVIMLLTTTLMLRSFERSKYASNVRVDEAVINAATPALDRAKAKLGALFTDHTLPPTTPSDTDLYNAIANHLSKYTLGDEKPLKLVYDIDGGGIKPDSQAQTLEQRETLTTAWRFPVDTDNNGKYDSYTLYGIYFRSPTRDNITGQFNRPRNPLEARTPLMDDSTTTGRCAAALGTSASPVDNSGWYKLGEQLKKSFYVYTATVPITNTNHPIGYETYRGNKGFSALEFQQDRARISLINNAVVYESDLEIAPDTDFRLNGRIVTNSNLLTGSDSGSIALYQVSSKNSCFYTEENSKIVVGGNVAGGSVTASNEPGDVNVHLFKGAGLNPDVTQTISSTNKSTSNTPREVAYNSQAYAQRIALLVESQFSNDSSTARSSDPVDIQSKVNAVPDEEKAQERRKQLEIYFRNRTRRVPFSEIPYGTDWTSGYTISNVLQGSGDTLRPPDAWMYPTSPSDGITSTGYTALNLKTAQLQATEPQAQSGTEKYLGDRIQIGNNLPTFWFQDGAFVGAFLQKILGATWTGSSATRYRQTRVQPLADLSITNRDGFWEAAAAKPTKLFDNNGGLRVVTGAGVYSRVNSFLPKPTYDNPTTIEIENLDTYDDPATPGIIEQFPIIWSDTMPMTKPGNTDKGDLKMRATAVYHYAKDTYDPNSPADYQTPIACVSSYYDPSTSDTAENISVPGGRSNNGLSYKAPTTTAKDITTGLTLDSNGLFLSSFGADNPQNLSVPLVERLKYQANLKFPNGRFVNEPLRESLIKKANNQNLKLSEQSAIDATICALTIADGTLNRDNSVVPDDAIKEVSFLDARQIKAIEDDNSTTNALETFTINGDANLTGNYNLSIEERQPLEVRATVLDIDVLRKKTITGSNVPASIQEYLLPNSGILYASRDDALTDLNDKSSYSKHLSSIDFKLDPTRRPNGILLTNGSELWRKREFKQQEKGLILATNLPVYVKGNFNLHSGEEFTNKLQDDWSNFYERSAEQINYNFACRPGDPNRPNCTTGDSWRPATVLADAITLLSQDFQTGFRNEGDYDLKNNQGDRDSIDKRLKNGFWNNNFVTSRDFQDSIYSGNTATTNDDSSYFNNFVTPIQRRVKFPEYVMEICRKLPISQCGPNDWVVGYDANGSNTLEPTEKDVFARDLPTPALANRLGAGTTAKPALEPEDRRYARRVAFSRSPYNTLELTQWPSPNIITAKPIGITSGQVQVFEYSNSPSVPTPADNALWFRTTDDTSGLPNNSLTYAANKPLYYEPPVGGKLLLPDIPDIPELLPRSLNSDGSTSGKSPSDYLVCFSGGAGSAGIEAYQVTFPVPSSPPPQPCPADVDSLIKNYVGNASSGLLSLPATISDTAAAALPNELVKSDTIQKLTLNADRKVNIYDITDFKGDAKITLNAGTQTDPVFVLKAPSDAIKFGENCPPANVIANCGDGIVLTLNGVSPNNVLWVFNSAPSFERVKPSKPHILAGNFLGNTGAPQIGENTKIEGGRFLGFASAPDASFTITAVTSDAQPLLVPVLQLHSTNGNPPNNPNDGGTNVKETRWMMKAAKTTFNLVAAAGDTPTRVSTTLTEGNGGLQNFVRFLENWTDDTAAKISGSFIQLKPSAYATAPFITVSSNAQGGIFNYPQAYRTVNGLLNNNWGNLPYYIPPKRQWEFDVALLSQLPDLFSQKFTLPAGNKLNEFFREVNRDDVWIQTLLCAAVNENPDEDSTYEKFAVDNGQRPSCPRSLSDYQ